MADTWFKRWLRRIRRPVLLIPTAIVFALAAAASWLLFSQAGLQRASNWVTWVSDDAVHIEGARGRLFGPLSLERLSIESAGNRYILDGLELAWNPMALFDGLLEIHRLKAARVELALADVEPAAPPAALRPPLAVRVEALEIGILALHDTAQPAQVLARDLQAAFSSDRTTHRLDALAVTLDAGALSAQGTLAAIAPFELRAEARLAGSGTPALKVTTKAGGTLEAISLDIDGDGQGFSIAGQASLRPFAAQPLAALRMTARGLDPRVFVATAPRALLALDVDLAPQSDGALAGRLRVDNTAPAPLDRGGLPFSRAETRLVLHWDASPRRLRLDGLLLKVGAGGTASGRVDLVWPTDAPWPTGDADLKLAQLDPSALHSALRPARLAGRVLMSGDATAQQATLALVDGAPGKRRLDAEFARRGDTLTLSRLLLAQGAAELSGQGELRLDAQRAWRFAGHLRHFDPAAFVAAPQADLNAEFEGSGRLAPQLDGRLRFTLGASRLAGEALAGGADLAFAGLDRPDHLLAVNGKAHLRGLLDIRLGGSHLHLKGGWGGAAEKLQLSLKVPDLARHRALVAPWLPGLPPDSVGSFELSIEGTPAQHRLAASAGLAAGRKVGLSASGALRIASQDWRDTAWQGVIETLSLSGDLPLALLVPAQLAASRARITLGTAELAFADGRIALAESTWRPGHWSSRGRFDGIALRLGEAVPQSGPPPARASGEWTLSSQENDTLAGHLRASVPDLRGLGPAIDGNLSSAGALAIDATFAGSFAAPLLSGQVRGSGLALSLIDENIQLRDGEMLIRFDRERALVERLTFVAPHQPPPRAAQIVGRAGFPAPQEPGHLSISGEFDLRQAHTRLAATLTRVPLAQRTERWVVASGTINLEHADARLRLAAQLLADAGYIAEAVAGRPALADDIVVLGRAAAARRGPRIESDIGFDLGEHFHLRAGGLAARLAGRLRVRGGDGPGAARLAATGSIATRDATFDAYGQRLSVERGIVNFQGPLDDPGLNILALRKGLAVEAGVSVTGTVQRPLVRLVSTPPVSDAEKLSWIVLGRAPDAGGTDASLLLAAAGAILGGQGDGVTAQLAQAFGVDEVSLRQAATGEPLTGQILVLGKRLSARTYLGYEQGLSAATGAVKLTHALTPRISIVTRAGEDNAIDVFYHFAFD
ncbi:MAG: translocation/assembly module TamB domain-containing protein [Rhodocyclaceae bacterium]|nr:translocation/assembly module TamB domain-containing protein [Rhodocyclaceae bacterium]